ncbi:MAG: HNH endonuclease [Candidatus Paceibacterota bacterium]
MIKDSSLEEVKKIFQHISISSFIKYFEVFEKHYASKDNTFIFENFDKNKEYESWTDKSYKSRATKGKKIFRNKLEDVALEYVTKFANKNRLSPETIEKANRLLKNRENSIVKIEPIILNQIKEIENNKTLLINEKTALVKIRLGQSNYRRELIEYWETSCVTKLEIQELLIASHIKPFSECNENEKYDLFNGLLLTPNYDKLFDKFLISFDKSGKILISTLLEKSDMEKLGISREDKLNSEKISPNHFEYLKYHNDKFNERERNNNVLQQGI